MVRSRFALITLAYPRLEEYGLHSHYILNACEVVAFSKEVEIFKPFGNVGADINERNITWSDSSERIGKEDISEVTEIQERYKEARALIAKRTHKDRRTQQSLLAKYG